ncbi:hypothetical protein SteCoe_5165 [Stentor coeruleus]|uniref:Uncharacterized protein n=1 Tax=Stentor coeruleus TaxID=5963 RepID=A0A1R2CT70_9CILI|nr:hypothetical protein SteCoe_5165 [Stentor coeruleus]
MKRNLDIIQNKIPTSIRSPNSKTINTSYQPQKFKPNPLDLSGELSSFCPPKIGQRAFLSPQSVNSFDIDFFNDSFKEKPSSQESKIRMLESTIEQNRLAYEKEKKVQNEYIELLKRKLFVLTSDDGQVREDTCELTNDNLKLRGEVSKLNSIISDKDSKIITLQEEVQTKSLDILQLTKKLNLLENFKHNLVSENEKISISKSQDDQQIKLKLENINLMEQITEKNKEIQILRNEKKKIELDTKAFSYKQLIIELKDKVHKSLEKYEKEFYKVKDQVERIDSRLALSTKNIRFLQSSSLTDNCKTKALEKEMNEKSESFFKTLSTRNEILNNQAEVITNLEEKINELHNQIASKEEKIDILSEEIYEYKMNNDGHKSKFDEILSQKDKEITFLKSRVNNDSKFQEDKIISLEASLLEMSKENLKLNIEMEEKVKLLKLQDANINEKSRIIDDFNEKMRKSKSKLKKLLEINKEGEKNNQRSLQIIENLKAEISEKESLIYVLQEKNDGLDKKLRDLQEKNDGLVKKIRDLEEKNDGMIKKLRDLEEKNDGLVKKLRDSEEKNDGLIKKLRDSEDSAQKMNHKVIEEIKHQKQMSEIEVKDKSNVIERQKKIINELEDTIQKCTNELTGIKEELAKKATIDANILQNAISEKNIEIEEYKNALNSTISEKNLDIEKIKKEHVEIIEEKDKEIEEYKNALNSTIYEKNLDIEKIKKEHVEIIEEKDKEINLLKEEQSSINIQHINEIETLKKTLVDVESEFKTKKSLKNKEKINLDLINSLKEQYNDEVIALREKLKKSDQNYQIEMSRIESQYNNKLDNLRQEENAKFYQIKLEKSTLEKEVDNKDQEIKELSNQIKNLKIDIQNAEAQKVKDVDNMKKNYEGLIEKIKNKLKNVWTQVRNKDFPRGDLEINEKNYENIIKESLQHICNLESAIKYLEEEFDKVNNIKSQQNDKILQIEDLENRIKNLINENAIMRLQYEKNKNIIERKNTNMEEQNSKIDELNSEITEYKIKYAEKKEESKDRGIKITELLKENEELMKKIEGYESIIKELDEGIALSEQRKKEVQDSLENEANKAKAEVKKLIILDEKNKNDIKTLKATNTQIEAKISILEKENKILKEENSHVKKRLLDSEELNKQINDKNITQYQSQINNLNKIINEHKEKIKILQQEIDKNQEIIKELKESAQKEINSELVKSLETQLKDKESECLNLQKSIDAQQKGTEKLISAKENINAILIEVKEHEQMFKDLRTLNIHTFEGRQLLKSLREKSEEQERSSTELAALITEIIESLR